MKRFSLLFSVLCLVLISCSLLYQAINISKSNKKSGSNSPNESLIWPHEGTVIKYTRVNVIGRYLKPSKSSVLGTDFTYWFAIGYYDFFSLSNNGDIDCTFTSRTSSSLYRMRGRGKVSATQVSDFIDLCNASSIFSLEDRYEAKMMDGTHLRVIVETAGTRKSIFMENLFPKQLKPLFDFQYGLLSSSGYLENAVTISDEEVLQAFYDKTTP